MRRYLLLVVLLVVPVCTGCSDARAKRAASLLQVKTAIAKAEYEAATTPEARHAVATQYFGTAPKFIDALAAYVQGDDVAPLPDE